jgi:hypothetical protein
MNYVLISFIIATSWLIIDTFISNNQLVEDTKNIKEISKNIDNLAILNAEDLTDDLTSANLIIHSSDKNYDSITLLNKLQDAVDVALQTKENPTCSDLAITKKITLEECNKIAKANFDFYNMDNDTITLEDSEKNNKYIANIRNTMQRKGIMVTNNSFKVSKVSKSGLDKEIKIRTSANRVKKDVDKIIKMDETGDLSVVIASSVADNNFYNSNVIIDRSIKKIQDIKRKKEQELGVLAAVEATKKAIPFSEAMDEEKQKLSTFDEKIATVANLQSNITQRPTNTTPIGTTVINRTDLMRSQEVAENNIKVLEKDIEALESKSTRSLREELNLWKYKKNKLLYTNKKIEYSKQLNFMRRK